MALHLKWFAGAAFVLGCLVTAGDARGQLSADPYKPYNAEYEQYIYPSYPSGLGVTPNQTLLEGRGGAARAYQRFMEEEDEMDRAGSGSSAAPFRRGVGVPYYRAYRHYDEAYNRVYTPNKEADQRYMASRRTRDEIYSQYLTERDPKKKAQLLKEYREYSQRALRQLNETPGAPPRRTPRSAESTVPPRPPVPGSARTRRPSETLDRALREENASRKRPEPSKPAVRPAAPRTTTP
jgi:hypothetical protein